MTTNVPDNLADLPIEEIKRQIRAIRVEIDDLRDARRLLTAVRDRKARAREIEAGLGRLTPGDVRESPTSSPRAERRGQNWTV